MVDMLAGRYALGEELGRGGMARVVAARDLRLDRTVAIKLLPADQPGGPDETSRRRFVREAQTAAAFSHPHAVPIFDAGDQDGVLYLVMELVDGESLAALLARRGPLDPDESVDIADQVLQALGAAHRAGIVHRDVKPGNVLISHDGVAKLADFGIAKRLHDVAGDLTMAGEFVGTPSYLAPEQVVGEPATPATDLYSTGVVLFEMLTNGPPFEGSTPMAKALAHRDAPVPDVRERRADVPAHVAAAISRAMAKDPAARYDTADDMRRALAEPGAAVPLAAPAALAAPVAAAGSVAAAAVPATEVMAARTVRAPSRRWWWVALAGAGAVTLAVVLLDRGDDPDELIATAGATTPLTAGPAATAAPLATAAAPTPAPTVAPTSPPPVTMPPPTAPPPPATIEELITLIDADPAPFGRNADRIRRDLEQIADGGSTNRLRSRLEEWTADETLAPEAAELIIVLLPPADGGGDGDEGGDGDGDDD